MEKLYINLYMQLCLVILPAVNYIHSLEDKHGLLNYPDCVEGTDGFDLVDGDRGKFTPRENNTSTSCKTYCMSLRYRIAGTRYDLCMCAESIKFDVETAICDIECPGDEKEVCGGKEGISLHSTGYQNTETTEQEVTTTTIIDTTAIITLTQTRTELSSTKSQIKSEIQITVTTETTEGVIRERVSSDKEQREDISTVTVVGIAVPSVIIVAGASTLVICLILRRRRLTRECSINYYTKGSEHTGHTSDFASGNNFEHGNLRGIHNDNKSSTSQYIEENAHSSADGGAEYSTVSSADSPQASHTYGCLKSKTGMNPTKSSEYSHMTVTKANSSPKFTDNTYAHIGNDKALEHSTENDTETDNTYNTLKASSAKNVAGKISKSEVDQYALYDHATAGIGNKKRNNADEYAHLNSVKAKATTSKGNNKINNVCEAKESQETVVYEEATHDYFILEPKK